MTEGRQLVEAIRAAIKPLNEKILNHPYLEALEGGRIPREKLKIFVGQQHHIIDSDLRSMALLVHRYGAGPSGPFFAGVLEGERAAKDALAVLAKALGMASGELGAFEPLPGAHAYCAFVAWLAMYASDAEVAAAFLVNLPAWGANCGRMSRGLRDRFGIVETSFFDLFADPPPDFEAAAGEVIERGLRRGVDPGAIRRAAKLLQAYELMYWDAIYGASRA